MNNSISGWERKGTHRFAEFGKQKAYVRTSEYIEHYEGELPFT